ncbi:PREDICTED: laminin subunit gamma-1-like [Branchiostoma belcheri]|uniref:Laminin subunit gamma-1-like n=1 Tax=Branchiostoma belcheri TaxID=7741 RepID=A0A6P4ZPN0_BRABE|nr:PREDICTED: laminin subunit gamma-1-like [Branchiostoma belcheri]
MKPRTTDHVLIWILVLLFPWEPLLALETSKCEEEVDGEMVYYACLGATSHLSGLPFDLTVTPAQYTCGSEIDGQVYDDYATQDSAIFSDIRECSLDDSLPEFMVDEDSTAESPTFWQSISWLLYPTPLHINITLSFPTLYELGDDITIAMPTARPRTMVLEKSLDHGRTWQTMQYYAYNCREAFGLEDKEQSAVSLDSATEITCTGEDSDILPMVGEPQDSAVTFEKLTQLYNDRSNVEGILEKFENDTFRELFVFTDLRIQLLYPATDGTEVSSDLLSKLQNYYTISNIDFVARCYCNLHGLYCNNTMCECQHNTAGPSCERCLPLYNNRPWRRGSYLPQPGGTANECQKCNCNDHADSCVYNATLGHGVCQDCQHNTTGVNCSVCQTSFYRNDSLPFNYPDICITCNCEALGVRDSDASCDPHTGQCHCKAGVTGLHCDQCVNGTWGLLSEDRPGECKNCSCDTLGTLDSLELCDQTTGQCPCKTTTETATCGRCKDKYWRFPVDPEQECLPCLCDVGGSASQNTSCDQSTGQCDCRPNLQGLCCNQTQDGYYVPGLDFLLFEAEENTETNCSVVTTELPETLPFTGRGFVSCTGNAVVTFNVEVEQNWFYTLAVRHTVDNNTTLPAAYVEVFTVGSAEVNGSSVGNDSIQMNSSTPTSLTVDGNSTEQVFSLCPYESGLAYTQNITLTAGVGQVSLTDPVQLDRRCRYQVSVHLDGAGAPVVVDSLLLIPDVTKSVVYELADNSTKEEYEDCVRSAAPLPTGDTASTEQCQQMVFSLSAQMYDGARACDCDPVGTLGGASDCSAVGGQCRCKPGVGGTRCDTCIPGYHGFSQEGCSACNCSDLGSVHLVCDLETGQCPCHPGVANVSMPSARNLTADLQCRSCQLNYFGFESGGGCDPCLCNETGSVSPQCDETGQCPCQDTVGGQKCDVCLPGFFNFSSQGPCGCDEAGSEVMNCDQTDGSCDCKFNVEGEKCSACQNMTFNLAAWNPDGCQDCFCFGHSHSCRSAVGFLLQNITVEVNSSDIITAGGVSYYSVSRTLVGDHTRSYGLNLVLTLDLMGGDDEVSTDGLVELTGANFTLVNWGTETLQVDPRSNSSGSTAALQEVSLLLHETFWNISDVEAFLHAVNFSRLLSDLTSVKVPRQVGNTTVTLHRVVLQTAVAMADPALPPVLSVENCSCPDGLSGLSCDECAPGYHRAGELDDRFMPCVACNCSNNTLTSPPQCDSITGECLNCRPGRTGKHCELCDHNVVGPDCDRCAENTYGLGNPDFPGCRNCSCSPWGSVNASCDLETGQCYCSNSTEGLKCDECKGNLYYNNETLGCIECEGCYDQIETRTAKLRLLRDNITQFVNMLNSGDNQNVLFSTRLETIQSQVAGLYNRSQETEDVAAEMHDTLKQLNTSAQEVLLGLTVAVESEVKQIEGLFQQALGNISSGQAERNATVRQLKRAYNVINNSLPGVSAELDNLVDTLNQTLAEMAAIQGEVNISISTVLGTLGDIQTSALRAFQQAQQAQQVASKAVALHQNTTELIQQLNQTARNISASLDSQMDQVLGLYGTVSHATQVAMDTARSVNSTESLPTEEVVELIERSRGLQERANKLTLQVTSNMTEAEATAENIQQAQKTTAQFDGEVQRLQEQADSLHNRSSQAFAEAQAAVQRAQDNFTAAEEMLNVLQNFTVLSQAMQEVVAVSLQQVEQVQSGSLAATQQAQQLQQDLQLAAGTAQAALQQVENMQEMVNNRSQETSDILSQAEALNTSAAALPSADQAAGNVSAANSSRVPTMQQACRNLTQDKDRLEAEVRRVGGQVIETQSSVVQSQQTVSQLASDLQNVQLLDRGRLQDIRNEVEALRTEITSEQLDATIQQLQDSSTAQHTWIQEKHTQITTIRNKLQNLQILKEQLGIR